MKKQPQSRSQPQLKLKEEKKDEKDTKHSAGLTLQPVPLSIPIPLALSNPQGIVEEPSKQLPPSKLLPSINLSQPVMQSTFYSKKFNSTTAYLHSCLSCPTLNFQLSKTGFIFRRITTGKRKTFKFKATKRRGNGIPNSLLDRLKLCLTIFKDPSFIQYYNKTPLRKNASIEAIAKYISNYSGNNGELDKFAMIYYYICNQITYLMPEDKDKDMNKDKENAKGKETEREKEMNKDINKDINKDNDDIMSMASLNSNSITNRYKENDMRPDSVLKLGTANSEGFSSLFEYFCKYSKLSYKRIDGYCKYFNFKPGDKCNGIINHSWHRIRIKNEWYFIDVTFGSGGNQKKNPSLFPINYFNPYYFLTPPEFLIDSHRPIEDEMQMNTKTVILKNFSSKSNHFLAEFYQKVYEKDIELLTHDYPIISIPEKQLSIKIRIKDVALQANLFTKSGRTKLGEVKYIMDENDNSFTFDAKFPGTGSYMICIVSRSSTSTDLIYYPLINYSVHVGEEFSFKRQLRSIERGREIKERQSPNMNMNTLLKRPHTIQGVCKIIGKVMEKPAKKICLDNNNAYLFEPRMSVLKIGNETRFRVKIKGAVAVIVLDGRKWNYLKRKEEDIWEGVAVIQTENVSICSLKNCNVFTEVFLFKAIKVVEQKIK